MSKAVFFIATTIVTTVVIAATLGSHHRHHHHHHPPPPPPPPLDLTLTSNASQLLRSNGFSFIATLLHISPDLFLSTPSSESTLFAIPDSAISNLSIPPYITIQLLSYHISPYKLTLQDLFQKPLNTCLPTMFHNQKISITKKDEKNRVLEINRVLITHPDMFVHGPISIHGVQGPFASFQSHQEITELPLCSNANRSDQNEFSHSTVESRDDGGIAKRKAEWGELVGFLSSTGFAPFAVALYSVLDGVLEEHPDLNATTVFASPTVFELDGMPADLRREFLRSHLVPKRHSFGHLASMAKGESLSTLCPGREVRISETVVDPLEELLVINGVEITSPDLLVSESFVVHGITRPFPMDEVASEIGLVS